MAESAAPEPEPEPGTELETIPVLPVADQTVAKPRRQSGFVIEEIVVTAQKRAESINEVPIAIAAFSGEALNALGVRDTRDLGSLVPGFTYADSGYTTPIYTLRGIGFNDATYNATSTVGVYVDEVNLPYSVMTKGASLDLERVEVLKGPQGTLYGRNTTGGLINYIAKKPTEAFEAGITSGYSNFQTIQTEGYVSGPLTSTLKGRIAVRDIHGLQGWQYSLTRPDDHLGRQDKQSARGALDWAASDAVKVRFALEGWRDASEPQAPQPIGRIPQNGSAGEAAYSPQIRMHQLVHVNSDDTRVADWSPEYGWQLHEQFFQGSGHVDWTLSNDMQLTSIASYGQVRDIDSLLPQSGYSVLNAEQELNAKINTGALELRLASSNDTVFGWMLGGNLSRDSGSEFHKLFVDTNSALYPVTGENQIGTRIVTYGLHKADQLAGFANANWQFSDTWKIDLGGRYTQDIRRFTGCSFEPPDSQGTGITNLFNGIALTRGRNPADPIQRGECVTLDQQGGNEVVRGKLSESNLSGRAALNWTPDEGMLYFASFSRGFKSGGFPVLSASDQAQYTPVKQEELLAYELGSKNTLWDQRAQLNLGAFYYDYKDKQLLTRIKDQVFGPLPILQNAPKSRVLGVEGDVRVTPVEGLTLSVAASYIKTKIIEFNSTGFDGNPVDFAGRPFNFAPELQYTLIADYQFAVSDAMNLGLGGDYRYTGGTNSTLEEREQFNQPAYGLVNIRARLEDAEGRWTLSAFAQNLTDKLYAVSIIQAGDGAARYVGRPRSYGFSFSYRWF